MYKLVAVYKIPNDVDAFDKHYNEVHAPLARKVPGLKELRINKVEGTPRGASDLHLIAEMVFENKEEFGKAMKTEENMAAGKDLMGFAKEVVSIHFCEETVERF